MCFTIHSCISSRTLTQVSPFFLKVFYVPRWIFTSEYYFSLNLICPLKFWMSRLGPTGGAIRSWWNIIGRKPNHHGLALEGLSWSPGTSSVSAPRSFSACPACHRSQSSSQRWVKMNISYSEVFILGILSQEQKADWYEYTYVTVAPKEWNVSSTMITIMRQNKHHQPKINK